MTIQTPTAVYVVELEQPWVNWFGTLLSYYPSSGFCEVEDGDGVVHKVRISEVYGEDTVTPIGRLIL